jgi:hypothetical protein
MVVLSGVYQRGKISVKEREKMAVLLVICGS